MGDRRREIPATPITGVARPCRPAAASGATRGEERERGGGGDARVNLKPVFITSGYLMMSTNIHCNLQVNFRFTILQVNKINLVYAAHLVRTAYNTRTF
jgi:hypothetical protein